MLLAQVQVTNTINITLILSIISAAGLIIAPLTVLFFKALKGILKEIYDLKIWMATYQADLTDRQTAKLEECIHKLPGHPETVQPSDPDHPENS